MNIGVHIFFQISVLRKLHTIFHRGCISLHSHQQCTTVPLSLQPHQHLVFLDLVMMAILTVVKWYLIVALICMSLKASGVEHLFICLWALCMSSEKCPFRSFAHFLNWIACLPGVGLCEFSTLHDSMNGTGEHYAK